jgi:2-polyprenyl-3-methyl-5-hydroxy-6-metoxy-1,4-benzoquinol methylase
VNRQIAGFLKQWLRYEGEPPRLVELGCARSIWLPYFASELGYRVTGVDYSERGCELARAALASADTQADVVLADFFDPPAELRGQFDAVFSLGVAEHFDDTTGCISAFARFLGPNGKMITIVPNMTGMIGFLQKHLNRPVYDKHVPLDSVGLSNAHHEAGLRVLDSGYLISTNFGIVSLEGIPKNSASWVAKRLFTAALGRASLLAWLTESHLSPVRPLAAYVYCVAERVA